MFELIGSKLSLLAHKIRNQKIISHSGFLLPLVQLVAYSQTLLSKDYDSNKANTMIFLMKILSKTVFYYENL